MPINFGPAWENRELLLGSLGVTLQLFALAFLLSLVPALAIAIARVYGPRPIQLALVTLVYVVRGVPAVLVVLIIYYALPFVGPVFGSFESVLATLTAVQVIYVSEVFRAALQAIDKGQFEAAQSLGMGFPKALRLVVLPQAALVAAPAFMSSAIQLMQNTTIASGVALYDLLGRAQNIAVNTLDGSVILLVAPVYVVILLPLVRVARRLEARLARLG